MENGGVKNIVLIALVVVLSFFIGSLSADGVKEALLPSVAVAGAFVMLYLGKNSKYLIFYLPLVIGFVLLGNLGMFIAPAVLGYWIVMRLMGYVRFEWIGHALMDGMVLLIFLYMCFAFYRNPVAINALGIDSDLMGGIDYVACLTGVLSYVAVSVIPFTALELCKTIRNVVLLNVVTAFIGTFLNLRVGGGSGEEMMSEVGEAAKTTRFDQFSYLGRAVFFLLYAYYPLGRLLSSPWRLGLLLLCAAAVLIAGWRSTLIEFVLSFFVLAFLKRELTFILCMGAFCYAGLLVLSSEHALEDLPFGVQRSLCAIPGVHVSQEVEGDAEGSSDWRKEMWGWALDSRTHYIKDYVWGDGPGISKQAHRRNRTAIMRGEAKFGDNRAFAQFGVWHSGWITLIHRYGIVGLLLVGSIQLLQVIYSLLSSLRYRSTRYFPYLSVFACSVLPSVVLYHLGTGGPSAFFGSLGGLAVFKQLYVRARELGRDDSFFRSEPYTPLMIQDIREKEGQQALVNV